MNTLHYISIFILIVIFQNSVWAQCGETFTGEGTFYGYAGGGNCSFADPNLPAMTGAMNNLQYSNSDICGACAEVTGPRGTIVIRIEDQCPECKFGDIDLAEDAFPLVANKIDGRVSISWKIVACPVEGAVKLYFKEGSSRWWTAVQIRNHKYPIESVELFYNNSWIELERMPYNYFRKEDGMGLGPYTFRITDIYGNSITETEIPLLVTTEITGKHQFEDCSNQSTILQTIELNEGWNLVSIYVSPTPEKIPIELFPNALQIKNATQLYKKAQPEFLNTIKQIELRKPYLIYNTKKENIQIEGIIPQTISQTSLKIGWNLVAYPLSEPQNIDTLLSENKAIIEIVKNFTGHWQPSSNFNSIENFIPGNAYYIKVNTDTLISW
ncbi:MAG: hypothetical protein IPO21_18545 [Bacteroidales bacterium]|nr:hypothetical protein [Bacteroidales bacterium]